MTQPSFGTIPSTKSNTGCESSDLSPHFQTTTDVKDIGVVVNFAFPYDEAGAPPPLTNELTNRIFPSLSTRGQARELDEFARLGWAYEVSVLVSTYKYRNDRWWGAREKRRRDEGSSL